MRIYLQKPSIDGKSPRFCHLHLQEDIINGWMVIIEAGQQGLAGRISRSHFEQHDDALQALMKSKDTQISKGFRIVFAQGELFTRW
ncbi:hypothetical protein MNBD_GAMMA12-3394 [hydrothermal vent metagenome]|uniref:WGR domain-containing protein n=1 Tax=hydrothermal vent metagenome TaxID=652676 RepID=A0A3B0Z0J8_9ZZZZ